MLCPKCKNTVPEGALNCSTCSAKLNVVCPSCKAVNPVGAKRCAGCDLELLKFCKECNAANLPSAKLCRRCGNEMNPPSAVGRLAVAVVEKTTLVKSEEWRVESGVLSSEELGVRNEELISAPLSTLRSPHSKEGELPRYQKIEVKRKLNIAQLHPKFGRSLSTNAPQIDTEGEIEPELNEIFNKPADKNIISVEGKAIIDSDEPMAIVEDFVWETNELDIEDVTPRRPVSDNTSDVAAQGPHGNRTNNQNVPLTPAPLPHREEGLAPSSEILPEPDSVFDELLAELKDPAPSENELPQENLAIYNESDKSAEEPKEEYQGNVREEVREKVGEEAREKIFNGAYHDNIRYHGQESARTAIIKALGTYTKFIIGLSSDEGNGKTTVVKQVYEQVNTDNQIWLRGECTPLTQVTPFGVVQDALMNYFGAPCFCTGVDAFKKDSKKFFNANLKELDSRDVNGLINFLYPHQTDYYENILRNRDYTYDMLERFFRLIKSKKQITLVIDDFDLIDTASYDFICRLIYNGVADSNFKLIITYVDKREVEGFLNSNVLPANAYETVFLREMNREEMNGLIKIFLNSEDPMPERIKTQIFEYSQGSPAYAEQAVSFLSELTALKIEGDKVIFNHDHANIEIPKDFSEILQAKLKMFRTGSPDIYKLILMAALLGNKFSIDMLLGASDMENEAYKEALRTLLYFGYFIKMNDSTLAFKNTLLWRECYDFVKLDDNFVRYNQRIYDAIACCILSNNTLKALVAQNLKSPEYALNYWTENTRLCAYIGDVNLYIISQQQSLKTLENYRTPDETPIKNNIYERIGKLLSDSAPEQAMEFLTSALLVAQSSNDLIKVIDIAAYLGASAALAGNYFGVIETVDLISKIVDKQSYPLEHALVKQKKLNAICMLGNTEELINIAENDILPVLKGYTSKIAAGTNAANSPNALISEIWEGWFDANLTLANAYILQGSSKGFPLLASIQEAFKLNQIESKYYWSKVQNTLAFAYTMSGEITKSQEILRDTKASFVNYDMEPDVMSRWNFINILNKTFLRQYGSIKEELFNVVTFANNCGDEFTKNILKTMLGKIIKESGNLNRAMEIYNEQVTYFAQEKIAIGAMLAWYLIIEGTLLSDGPERALEIVEKALDVAKNPKINNHYFMILYQMQIAEIYMIKGDLEATKMYLEKAIAQAQTYNLNYLKIKLYLLYGKYFEEKMNKTPDKADVLASNISKNYEKAMEIAENLKLDPLIDEVATAQQSFVAFSQLKK